MSDAPNNIEESEREAEHRPWSRRGQEVGIVVWSSFLAACLATMVFFAFFDPLQLGSDEQPPRWLPSAMSGYAIGFFFFWAVCAVAASLTSYLLDTLPPTDASNRKKLTGTGNGGQAS